MIRFLFLIFLPLAAPYVVWFLWNVFAKTPRIDPATGDQVPPDFADAPKRGLLAIGLALAAVTVAAFLFFQHRFAEAPYKPIGVMEYEKSVPAKPDER